MRVLLASALLLGLTGCGPATSSDAARAERTLTVFAAASLTSVFTALGEQFEDEHPGVTVTFNFGGSSDLVAQIVEGAPADVFASADSRTMQRLTDESLEAAEPASFATNTLQIATPPGNPAGIRTLADLAGVDLVLCAPQVPCGAAAERVGADAGVDLRPVSEELNVKDVLAKVTSGEADAGLVYVTDVRAAGDEVVGVSFPESAAAVNTYPIVALRDSGHGDLAAAFVALVLGDDGRAVLAGAGFQEP